MAAAGLRSGLRGRSLWLALLGPLARGNRSPGFPRLQVGSRAGAVFRRPGLAVAPRFLWECLTSPAVNPSPTPATSNGAGGFPALRFPVRFTPRLMRPTAAAAPSAAIGRLLHLTRPIRPAPRRISPASGLADRRVLFSRHPCLPCCRKSYEQQGSFAPRALPRFRATTDPSATLSSSADFPVLPVIRPTQLPPFPVGTRRASPVARWVLVVVPSLTTPPERPALSIGLGRVMLPSPSRLRARPPGLLTFGATSRSPSLRPERLAPTPRVGSSRGFRTVGFPPACPPSYGAADSYPGRTDSC